MIRIKENKFEYLIDCSITDDETGNVINYKKSVWVKSLAEIEAIRLKSQNAINLENQQHTDKVDTLTTNLNFWENIISEINDLQNNEIINNEG